MQAWTRPPEPPELRSQRAALTLAFLIKRKETGKTPSCDWPKVQNESGEMETLQELLSRQTLKHCCYCDGYMGYCSRDTIDHFLPKKYFSLLAYKWSNLYFCCDGCQRKGSDYHRRALRPDEPGYTFSRYFRSHRNGLITIIAEEKSDYERAEITLKTLKLNHPKLVEDRALEFNKSLSPRRRPLRPGLDQTTALKWFSTQETTNLSRPYRFHYPQDPQ